MTWIELDKNEKIADRPFSDPVHSQSDLDRMWMMAQQLVDKYDDPLECDFFPGRNIVSESYPEEGRFQIYYIQPELLFSQKNLTVVGFFGLKRPGADIEPLNKANKRFEEDFRNHPGLLSLSTAQLPSQNFANLVIFKDPQAKDKWNRSELHGELVAKISPPYYQSIRLNNGLLPAGLTAPEKLRLIRVKYIDYTTDPHWRAVRTFDQGRPNSFRSSK